MASQYKVVEIEKILGVPELDEGSASSVASLRDHPGMQYLLAKFRLQAQLVKATLANTRHKEMRDVEFLQSGIAWLSWMQQQLDKALAIQSKPQPRVPTSTERDAFEALSSQIDWVGASKTARKGRADNSEPTAPQGLGA